LGNVVFKLENIAVDSKYRDMFFDFKFGFSDDVEAGHGLIWESPREPFWLNPLEPC